MSRSLIGGVAGLLSELPASRSRAALLCLRRRDSVGAPSAGLFGGAPAVGSGVGSATVVPALTSGMTADDASVSTGVAEAVEGLAELGGGLPVTGSADPDGAGDAWEGG